MVCRKCNKWHPELQWHHIIPKGIIDEMKYKFIHTISNKIPLCSECHAIIHEKYRPYKYHWKVLHDKTLKMKRLEDFNKLIEETLEFQMKIRK